MSFPRVPAPFPAKAFWASRFWPLQPFGRALSPVGRTEISASSKGWSGLIGTGACVCPLSVPPAAPRQTSSTTKPAAKQTCTDRGARAPCAGRKAVARPSSEVSCVSGLTPVLWMGPQSMLILISPCGGVKSPGSAGHDLQPSLVTVLTVSVRCIGQEFGSDAYAGPGSSRFAPFRRSPPFVWG